MKKLLIVSLVSVCAVSAADAGVYFSEKLHYGFTRATDLSIDVSGIVMKGTNETGSTFGRNTAVGYDFGEYGVGNIRAEAEFGMGTDSKFTTTNTHPLAAGATMDARANAISLFANAYYDFATGTDFTPYVGAGLGYGHTVIETAFGTETSKIKGDSFIYNFGAGVAYSLCDKLSIDLGYRWTDFGKFEGRTAVNHNEIKGALQEHSILLGARYAF